MDACIEEFQRRDHIPEATDFEEGESAVVPTPPDQHHECATTAEPSHVAEDGNAAFRSASTEVADDGIQCDFRSWFFSVRALMKPNDVRVITGVTDAA